MCRKIFASFILILFIPSVVFSEHPPLIHPKIPKSTNKVEIAIVILNEEKTNSDIEEIIKSYPNIEIRHMYKHALNGFSVQGKLKDIEELTKDYNVQHVSTVKTYQVTAEESVPFIGVQEVRGMFDRGNIRLTGKGVKVGVIDTGVDYTHPDLTRNVAGGKDLVDEDDDPMETKIKGKFNTIHGTHVAGVIAANGKIQGVAPDATILAYRALGPNGIGTTEQIIAAIDTAITDKVDILNLSLGNSINGPDLPISLALNEAVDQGVVAVTSNGNAGPHPWTVGSPGTATKAISVGASTPPMQIPYLKVENISEIRLQPFNQTNRFDFDRSYEIVDGGLGTKTELKHAKGKIAIIKRGKLTFTEKAMNAAEAGAVAAIIFNNTSGSFGGNIETGVSIPLASISKQDGEQLMKLLKQQKPTYAHVKLNKEEDLLADFSSRGPVTVTWEIKPDVVAPGVAINSTIPGGYLSLQGTSMAAPHVAGAAALIKQAHPDWTPEQIKAALMNTAQSLANLQGQAYRTFEQGAGRIQIAKAINAESLVTPASLQFGKFQLADRLHRHQTTITVENKSNQQKHYYFSIPKKTTGIQWKMPKSFTLQPGEKKKLTIEMELHSGQLTKKMYDGVLTLNAGYEQIQIPYLYVIEEPNYPRVMGFEFELGDGDAPYRYEVYLPGGADEFGIALFDPDDFRFVSFLDTETKVDKGILQKNILKNELPEPGIYIAKVFAKKAGQEDTIEAMIEIGNDVEKERK